MRRFVAAIAGIAVLMSVTTGMASAAGGRLSFTGMILAPTCSPAADAEAMPASGQAHERCPAAAANAGYTVAVEPAATAIAQDRLLDYFGGYLHGMNAEARARLVTQTYD